MEYKIEKITRDVFEFISPSLTFKTLWSNVIRLCRNHNVAQALEGRFLKEPN